MSFEVGDRVGDYEVIAVLGAGGMGKVYKVRNVISDRVEAMKVLLPNLEDDADLADRFLREIKVQASLDHPNIAALHTAQRNGNQILMILEYVEGTTVEALIKHGRINAQNAIRYMFDVLNALAYAHERGVVHRDIKPANMMITTNGEVKLMDFGIARVGADKRLTQTGRTVGSLFYMSPEQIRGAGVDARSDLYAVGISLYEMVTGKRPFEGDSDYSIMAAHLQQNPVPPIELDPTVPMALNEIILMALSKDPEQRFQSAVAFRSALQNVGEMMGVPAAPPSRTLPMLQEMSPEQSAPVPAAAASPAKNRRALYMVVGSLVTLAVLAVGLTQIPKFLGTRAESEDPKSQTPQNPPKTEPQAEPSGQQPAVQQPAGQPTPQVPTSPPGNAAQTPGVERPASGGLTRPQAQNPAQRYDPPPASQQPASQQPPSRPEPAKQDPPKQEPVGRQQSQPASNAALNELRERYNDLAVRASAVKTSLKQLEQQLARQGLGLRTDAVEASTRFDASMQEAMTSIRASDAENAKKYLDRAGFALEAMSKIIGH